jgi:hypothetical protein
MFMRIHGRPDFAMARNILVVARHCHIGRQTLLSMVYGLNMQRVDILHPVQLKHLI